MVTMFTLIYFGFWKGPRGPSSTWKEQFSGLEGIWGYAGPDGNRHRRHLPGVFTPTEASGIGAIGALVILIIKKGVDLSVIKSSLNECLRSTSVVFTIIISTIFARLMALTGLNMWHIDAINNWNAPP